MAEYGVGALARSKAGHDRGTLFIILEESEEYVYLADGICRTADRPKKKKKKHVQPIHVKDETLYKKLMQQEHVADEEIKRFIKCYNRENQELSGR